MAGPRLTTDPRSCRLSSRWTGREARGFTLFEVTVGTLILSFVLSVTISTILGAQDAVTEGQVRTEVQRRARDAMNRIVRLAGQALTNDPNYLLLQPGTGSGFHCFRFALVTSVNPLTGTPVFSSDLVYIYGPHTSPNANSGIVVGRGATLVDVYTRCRGADSVLGTDDDLVTTQTPNGNQGLELLVPARFAPRTGEMFSVTATPSPVGRLLTINLRLNAQTPDGTFVLENDLIVTERVALRE